MIGEGVPSERARQIHQNASYLIAAMGLEYDHENGEMRVGDDTPSNPVIEGTPGEVFTNGEFYVPGVIDVADRVDLAFEVGFLMGKKVAKEEVVEELPHAARKRASRRAIGSDYVDRRRTGSI